MIAHGISLSLGGTDPLDEALLARWKAVDERFNPYWCSEHIAFCTMDGIELNQLLPVRRSVKMIHHMASRIERLRSLVRTPVLIENITSYEEFPGSDMPEADFINEILLQTGCGLLLDLTNLFIVEENAGRNPKELLRNLPLKAVVEVHVSGGTKRGNVWVDSHSEPVPGPIWGLLEELCRTVEVKAVTIERDANLDVDSVLDEVIIARSLLSR